MSQHPEYGRRLRDRVERGMQVAPKPVSRKVYIYANAFEALIAVSAIIAAVGFFINPSALSRTSIGQVGFWDMAWNVLYFMGGVCTLFGLWLHRRHIRPFGLDLSGQGIELGGLIFLGAAVLTNAIVVAVVFGFTSALTTYVAVAVATMARGAAILSTRKMAVPVEVPLTNGD